MLLLNNKMPIVLFVLMVLTNNLVAQNQDNAWSTATIIPPQYESFKPPSAGQWFTDPVFGTRIKRLTDDQNIYGWNGERAMFSKDDKYFLIAVNSPHRLRLFDGRTGDMIRDLPLTISDTSIMRWSYDPQMLVYASGSRLIGYNVATNKKTTLKVFSQQIGDSRGRLCGGDGNDFDDAGEWLLLNMGTQMFAYNIRNGETGPQKDLSGFDVDYCTISPSGNYIIATTSQAKYVWNRDWTNERRLLDKNRHMDMGYLDGSEECVISRVGAAIMYAVRFSDGKKFEVLSSDRWFSPMLSAVGGSNKKFVYLAMRAHELDPKQEWYRYFGELVQVPLTKEASPIRRLAHHRTRIAVNGTSFADQPELWINHAGDRLFFRSNMDNYVQKGRHDLYMIKLDELSLSTSTEETRHTQIYTQKKEIIISSDLPSMSSVYDIMGRLITKSSEKRIPIHQPGIYIVVVEQEHKPSYRKKVLVQ